MVGPPSPYGAPDQLQPGVPQAPAPQGPGPQYGVPQPPMGQPPAAPIPTLGATNQVMDGNPITHQYADAIQGMLQSLQPFMEKPVPPQPGPGLLESLGTFGIANLKHIADENTRREENYRILQRNRQIGLKGVDLAVKATDAQATAAGLAGRMGIAQQGLVLRQQQFINDLLDKQRTQARQQVNDAFKFDTIPTPMGADAIDAATAQGYHPSTRFPGRWDRGDTSTGGAGVSPHLTQNPTTGAWEMPRAGSPAATALGAVGGGGATGDVAATLRQRKRQQEAAPPQTTKDVTSIDESIAAAKDITRLAMDPEVQKWMGPLAGRGAQQLYNFGGKIGGIELPSSVTNYLQKVAFLQAQATGPLLHGSRNMAIWRQIQMHLPKPHDTPKLALDKLQGLTDLYAKNRDILLEDADLTRGGGGDTATTDTMSSTTPPSSVGGTAPTPSTSPTNLNELLQKHGY